MSSHDLLDRVDVARAVVQINPSIVYRIRLVATAVRVALPQPTHAASLRVQAPGEMLGAIHVAIHIVCALLQRQSFPKVLVVRGATGLPLRLHCRVLVRNLLDLERVQVHVRVRRDGRLLQQQRDASVGVGLRNLLVPRGIPLRAALLVLLERHWIVPRVLQGEPRAATRLGDAVVVRHHAVTRPGEQAADPDVHAARQLAQEGRPKQIRDILGPRSDGRQHLRLRNRRRLEALEPAGDEVHGTRAQLERGGELAGLHRARGQLQEA
mmetsp:Transcript_158884/g.509525  ORF Transcript_158884/g.509525 Transcript_158884/m.509525 type:complete len:267 (-) Transcript_158884:246-1046(-)